jgi:hypothetical protein
MRTHVRAIGSFDSGRYSIVQKQRMCVLQQWTRNPPECFAVTCHDLYGISIYGIVGFRPEQQLLMPLQALDPFTCAGNMAHAMDKEETLSSAVLTEMRTREKFNRVIKPVPSRPTKYLDWRGV